MTPSQANNPRDLIKALAQRIMSSDVEDSTMPMSSHLLQVTLDLNQLAVFGTQSECELFLKVCREYFNPSASKGECQ